VKLLLSVKTKRGHLPEEDALRGMMAAAAAGSVYAACSVFRFRGASKYSEVSRANRQARKIALLSSRRALSQPAR